MKNKCIKKYLLGILLYSAIFLASAQVLDWIGGGGMLREFIGFFFRKNENEIFRSFSQSRELIVVTLYSLGLLIFSVHYVRKMSNLLDIAGQALINGFAADETCPKELTEFKSRLNELTFRMNMNEQARREAEQQKNDLVVCLAHDLKTPLTSVIGYITMLNDMPELPAEQRAKYTGIALDKAYRLESLINEFFDITRMNLTDIALTREPMNITILLEQIISEFYPVLEKNNLKVSEKIESELVINGDPDKLARVFDNLFRNAANYSYPDTEIVCEAYRCANGIQISIKNTGDTISTEQLQHIFDRFYRIDSSRTSESGGSGLGLSIAKQIVELHGGSISAASMAGETVFSVLLPDDGPLGTESEAHFESGIGGHS